MVVALTLRGARTVNFVHSCNQVRNNMPRARNCEPRLYAAQQYVLTTTQLFVKAGVTLTIEAGTTIKATPGDGKGVVLSLVLEQGARIMALGTAASPITFTTMAFTSAHELAASPRSCAFVGTLTGASAVTLPPRGCTGPGWGFVGTVASRAPTTAPTNSPSESCAPHPHALATCHRAPCAAPPSPRASCRVARGGGTRASHTHAAAISSLAVVLVSRTPRITPSWIQSVVWLTILNCLLCSRRTDQVAHWWSDDDSNHRAH